MRTALTIAGSDSGAGAGIQADLKPFAAHGVYGTSAITAVTAQNTRGVEAWQALPADLVTAQIEAVVGDLGADAVKIGMLANAAIVEAVVAAVRERAPSLGLIGEPFLGRATPETRAHLGEVARTLEERGARVEPTWIVTECSHTRY